MHEIDLTGEWMLTTFRQQSPAYSGGADPALLDNPDDLAALDAVTVPAQVPGNVELDLHRAGVLPDPFFGANIRLLRPYEFNEWWYTRDFDVPVDDLGAEWDLVFEGLDTVATVWVNGAEVGRSDNMLIEHRFDVTQALKPGRTNRVHVRLASALLHAATYLQDATIMTWETREEGAYIRKAPHVWGWDIMPRAVSAGIWRPLRLERRARNVIEDVYYWTRAASESSATVGVHFQVRTDRFTPEADLVLRFTATCGDQTVCHEWPLEFVAGNTNIDIPNPRLWWPKGYGDPNLYAVTVHLCDGDEMLAERTDVIGVRAIRVDRSESAGPVWAPGPEWGDVARQDKAADPDHRFVFFVNDVPILVKGANWVPLDAFHSRDADRVDEAVALFDDLGCNMIRCWGGNVYEDHRFFDLCDQAGIMVWQDFAFACCRYPQDEAFLDRVREEAEVVVRKLRNHASLALWCGDNEIDFCYSSDGIDPAHNRITREVVPRVTHRLDPHRHHVPTSPYAAPGADGLPEDHLWGPRGYYKGPYYTHHRAHFIGEIGYHGCPNVSSIKRFISENALWPWRDNEEWRIHDVTHSVHGQGRDRIKLMANQVRELFGEVPDALEDFALASQIVQAEAKKFFIESTRLRKWRTSGLLWWNVIDGWPQFSDAIVDYFFGKKLAYHYIRRVQQPVAVVIGEAGSEKYLPVVVCNDSRRDVDVSYRVICADTDEIVVEGAVAVPANQNWQVARIRTYASSQKLYLIEWTVNGASYGNHCLEGAPAHNLERYRVWLKRIADLPESFDPEGVAM
ncbi:MAG: glycoside hydrolase family 2 [bacterium]|nr:glycoside hydrolase family 2 [bacterium]